MSCQGNDKMAQRVKAGDLSSIPSIHVLKGEN